MILVIFLLLLFAMPAQALTRWVSVSGGVGAGCTGANVTTGNTDPSNYQTLAQGVACLKAGDGETLMIKGGTYNNTGLVIASGIPSAHTIVRTSGTVTFTGNGTFDTYGANMAYVDFIGDRATQNMIFDGTGLGDATAISICQKSVRPDCTGENHDLTFDGVRVTNWLHLGVYFYSLNNIFRYSRIDNNGKRLDVNLQSGYGFYISGGARDNIVEYNEIDNNGGYGIHNYTGYPESTDRNTYRYNRIHDNGFFPGSVNEQNGILISGGNGHQVYGNIIYGNKDAGVRAAYGCGTCLIYNNTFYNNGSQVDIYPDSASAIIRNNILHGSTPLNFHGASVTASNNLCTSACPSGTNNRNESAATTFINPGTDFRLKAGSAAISAGYVPFLSAPFNVDIAGSIRPQGSSWDLGAYEYTGDIPTPPAGNQLVLALPLDDGSGSTATDVSGQKNNAAFVGGVTWDNAGKYGKAVLLDGTGYLNVPASSSLALSPAMTLEAWIYPTVDPVERWFTIFGQRYWLFSSSASGTCPTPLAPEGGYFGTSINFICATSIPPINQWSHLALTYDGSNLTFYIDGKPVASQPSIDPMISDSNNLTIGSAGDRDFFIGKIDEPRIYNYARSPTQIISDMNTPLIGVPGKYVEIAAPTSVEISSASTLEIGAD